MQIACKRISRYFVEAVIILSLITMTTWFLLIAFGSVQIPDCGICWVVERGIGILVASCPCALGLAVPSVVGIVLNVAIKNGILIRNNSVIETMKTASVVAFDKTGTLFTRINKIEQAVVLDQSFDATHLWQILALVEKEIKHPLAELIYKEAFNRSETNGTSYAYMLVG